VSEREQGNVKRKQTVRMRIVGVCASGRCVYVCVCVCDCMRVGVSVFEQYTYIHTNLSLRIRFEFRLTNIPFSHLI